MTHLPLLVAVVDDDQRLLESLENLLESAGLRALSFSRGEDFLDDRRFKAVDCLLTDIGLPGMDGFALRDRVRALRPELPIFLMTGRHDIALQVQLRAPGENVFRKPFDGRLLLEAIEALRASRG